MSIRLLSAAIVKQLEEETFEKLKPLSGKASLEVDIFSIFLAFNDNSSENHHYGRMDHIVKKQFVIAEHTTPNGVHWDLMLEMGDVLRAWRLNTPPHEIKERPIHAERIFDHSPRFLTYEGPVQNGTGQVAIADKGTYSLNEQTDNSFLIDVQGEILAGCFSLSKTQNAPLWKFQFIGSHDTPHKGGA